MSTKTDDDDIRLETEMRLRGERIENISREFIKSECSTDIRGAAGLLGISISVARKCSKHWPVMNLGGRCYRYRISEILKYRDSKTTYPKH